MKKINVLYTLSLLMIPVCAMEETSKDEIEVNIGDIAYEIESTLEGKWKANVCRVTKTKSGVLAARVAEVLQTPPEGRNYDQKRTEGGDYLLVPTMLPVVVQIAPNASVDSWFETREFNVKGGGKFKLVFDADGYTVRTSYDKDDESAMRVVDSDTLESAQARYLARVQPNQ